MRSEVQQDVSAGGLAPRVTFQSDEEWNRIKRAAEVAGFADPSEFVREGALRLVDETIDEDGQFECPHDDCDDGPFATVRQRRGHLGNKHADVFPDGEFWCGYCGYGPTAWRGVNAHHSHRHSERGPPVRLDEEPAPEDLLAPEDIPDHQNPDLLERLYREHDGNMTEMWRAHDFDVTVGRIRHYLIQFGIHEPRPQGETTDGDGPLYRDRKWMKERYDAAGGNISEMHRRLEADDDEPDIPYRTLVNNIKRFDFYDPKDPPGKRHGKGGPDPAAPDEGGEDEAEEPDEDDADREADEELAAATDEPEPTDGDDVDMLDHTDREDLERAYQEANGNISEAAERFDVSYATVRSWMIDFGVHEPEQQLQTTIDEDNSDESADPSEDDSDESSDGESFEDLNNDTDDVVAGPTPTRADPLAALGLDDPADVESFHDLETPTWLDEGTFYAAVDMSDDVDELADVLGWEEPDRLVAMLDLLGIEEVAQSDD